MFICVSCSGFWTFFLLLMFFLWFGFGRVGRVRFWVLVSLVFFRGGIGTVFWVLVLGFKWVFFIFRVWGSLFVKVGFVFICEIKFRENVFEYIYSGFIKWVYVYIYVGVGEV